MAKMWRLNRLGMVSRRIWIDFDQRIANHRKGLENIYNCPPAFATTRSETDRSIRPMLTEIVSAIRPVCFVPQRGLATRQLKVNLFMSSPGLIAEPYRPPPPPLPILRRWFTLQGWRIRKKWFMEMLKTAYCLAKLRQKHKGYNQKVFYREATDLYKEINKLSAIGDVGKLRRLVTENFLSVIKNQIKQRQAAYSRVHWEMVGPIKRMRTLQGRLIGIDKKNLDNAFVQITVRIHSNQIFAAYDKNDNLVKGDLEKPLFVEDIWIFEKHLTRPDSTWRLCGQLNL